VLTTLTGSSGTPAQTSASPNISPDATVVITDLRPQ